MIEYYEFSKTLREIARRADTFNHDKKTILENIIYAAENVENVAEKLELQMIVDEQLSSKNSCYEYEFNS